MTTFDVAAVALQPLVWSPTDSDLFAEAVVEGSFTNAELRVLGDVFENEAQADTYRFYGDRNYWNLRGLVHSLREFRNVRRAFGGREDLVAVSILAERKAALKRDVAMAQQAEGFSHAFAKFVPREEALKRATAAFNPTPAFDPGDFLEVWWGSWDDLCSQYSDIDGAAIRGRFQRTLRQLQEGELVRLRVEAKEMEQTTRYDGLRNYYQFVLRKIDRLGTSPVGQAA